MTLELVVVDAFTERPFTGNPAAVAVVEQFPDPQFMQAVAAEMAISETAFCVARPDGHSDLRWFSPTMEIDLCGHATLATTRVLGGSPHFNTLSGVLSCRTEPDGVIRMDFPADPPRLAEAPPALGSGLRGAEVKAFARCRQDALVELADADSVRRLQPDMATIASLAERGVIVTAPCDADGVDCVSRFFAPNAGVPEDPVTGSAHCALAVWWGERTGRRELVGEQVSARGGTVYMSWSGERVELGGRAVIVSRVSMDLS